jgi:hypothetical protein
MSMYPMPSSTASLEDRFWGQVDRHPTDCWMWTGYAPGGYGRLRRGPKVYLTHRLAYHFANGPIPEGMLVCHTCDNPGCCRPSHLFLGTHKDNAADMWAKGRQSKLRPTSPRGEDHARTQLRESDVQEIRMLKKMGYTAKELSQRYPVGLQGIYLICHGKTWRHV